MVSDDLTVSVVDTYGCVIERAFHIACYLRRKLDGLSGQAPTEAASNPDTVVGTMSESCSEVVSVVLGILTVPAVFMSLKTEQQS